MNNLRRLARDWRGADKKLKEARANLAAALLEATEAGKPQKDMAAETEMNRETIRLMVNAARKARGDAQPPT